MIMRRTGLCALLSVLIAAFAIGFAFAETLTDGGAATATDAIKTEQTILSEAELVVPLGSAEPLGLTEEQAKGYMVDSSNPEIAEVELRGETEKEYFVVGKKDGRTKINLKNYLGEAVESREIYVSREAAIRAKLIAPKLEARITSSSTLVKLVWNEVEDVDGYKIYKWNLRKGKYILAKTIAGSDVTSWKDKELAAGKKYTYKIASYINSNGQTYIGAKSDKASAFLTVNARVYEPEVKYTDSAEGGLRMLDKSLGYKDGKLYYEAVIVNDNELYAESLKIVTISVYVNGKLAAKQDFIDQKLNLDAYSAKAVVFSFDKGTKKVVDLRSSEIKVSFEGAYKYAELKIKEL